MKRAFLLFLFISLAFSIQAQDSTQSKGKFLTVPKVDVLPIVLFQLQDDYQPFPAGIEFAHDNFPWLSGGFEFAPVRVGSEPWFDRSNGERDLVRGGYQTNFFVRGYPQVLQTAKGKAINGLYGEFSLQFLHLKLFGIKGDNIFYREASEFGYNEFTGTLGLGYQARILNLIILDFQTEVKTGPGFAYDHAKFFFVRPGFSTRIGFVIPSK